jgi:hypothetical protein
MWLYLHRKLHTTASLNMKVVVPENGFTRCAMVIDVVPQFSGALEPVQ